MHGFTCAEGIAADSESQLNLSPASDGKTKRRIEVVRTSTEKVCFRFYDYFSKTTFSIMRIRHQSRY